MDAVMFHRHRSKFTPLTRVTGPPTHCPRAFLTMRLSHRVPFPPVQELAAAMDAMPPLLVRAGDGRVVQAFDMDGRVIAGP